MGGVDFGKRQGVSGHIPGMQWVGSIPWDVLWGLYKLVDVVKVRVASS